ncbi:MAG: pro-sigmaK processing inhibitor BofA family protein [Clostridium sp.]|nr:pro-sigmaK processing inhibitor BofA family protein [Clostridium sp.]MCM1443780.1 pro-sigmaK processing inhibitor BofA family protein [Candidatus Amulumruptor caecigallinarius]
MLKKIFKILKKIVLSCFLLYGYNLIAAPLGVLIPINLITVCFVTIFGVPALCSFIVIFLLVF